MFAVPLAKSFGAHVTGICGTKTVEIAHQMGADVVLDYNAVDVHTLQETFDVIFDLAGRLSFDSIKHLLTPHGIFVDPAPTPAVMAGSVLHNFWHAQKHGILMSKLNCADAKLLADSAEQLPIGILLGAEFPLDQAAAAHATGEKGGGIGKLTILS
jgi:NADPH:quinone reductase-like Zn-dependent oxidoreductase